jgi:hypothetical protein
VSAATDRGLRSHVAATAAIAAGFLAALVLVVLVGQQQEPAGQPAPVPTETATGVQDTLLVQVTLERDRAASLLTASGGDPDRAVLLSLPADMLVVDGPAYTPLLDANLSLNRRLTARATAHTLGVRVDGGWRMERKALAGFVDAVGPVTVMVPERTEFLDTNGEPALTLPAGTSRLTGPDASWYAIGVVEGEDETAGVQQRFQEVFVQAVSALPEDAEAIKALLTSLGSLSDPLNGTDEVSQQLLGLRNALLAADPLPVELPFRTSSAADPVVTRQELEGGPSAAIGAFRVTDYVAATPSLRDVFAGAPWVAEIDGKPRVLVWNGSEQPLASEVALLELNDADFVAVSAGPWSSVQPVSRINGMGYRQDGQSYADAVAEALRLANPETFGETGTLSPTLSPTPTAAASEPPMMPPPDQTPWADVDVVFGQDYQPCPPDDPDCLVEEQ